MHAISSYRGNRPTNKPTNKTPTYKQTGPITIYCAGKLSSQCKYARHEWATRFDLQCFWPGRDLSVQRASFHCTGEFTYLRWALIHCALAAAQCIVIGTVCGRGSAAGRKVLAPPYYNQRAVFASLRALLSFCLLHPPKRLCFHRRYLVNSFVSRIMQ